MNLTVEQRAALSTAIGALARATPANTTAARTLQAMLDADAPLQSMLDADLSTTQGKPVDHRMVMFGPARTDRERDLVVAWARANDLDPARIVADRGVLVDLVARIIAFDEVVDEDRTDVEALLARLTADRNSVPSVRQVRPLLAAPSPELIEAANALGQPQALSPELAAANLRAALNRPAPADRFLPSRLEVSPDAYELLQAVAEREQLGVAALVLRGVVPLPGLRVVVNADLAGGRWQLVDRDGGVLRQGALLDPSNDPAREPQ